MQITPKFVNPAKEGKKFGSIVGQDDVRYPVPAAMVGRFAKGQTYDVGVEEQNWDGKLVMVVRSIGDAPKTSSTPPANGAANDKWWMPFVSNTVAHAIAAGQIKGPGEIRTWASAAKLTAEAICKPEHNAKSFDDLDEGQNF